MTPPLAIGLFSGGLDSILAAKIIEHQGVDVRLYHFISPFFGWSKKGCEDVEAGLYRQRYGLEVTIESVWPEYLGIVRYPRFGRGRNMNPCLDCKIFMLLRAGRIMEKLEAEFVFTGEILGQRPMSQRRDALNLIEKHSGLRRRLVRPLSAKLLPPTVPEEKGIIDRDKLYDFQGRSRKRQMIMAREMGIDDYPAPAGGCCLTDPNYARRLEDTFKRNGEVNEGDLALLALGRHFRLGEETRLIVGRNKEENAAIAALAIENDYLIKAAEAAGPTSLLRGQANEEELTKAGGITARYSDGDPNSELMIAYRFGNQEIATRKIRPMPPEEVAALMIK